MMVDRFRPADPTIAARPEPAAAESASTKSAPKPAAPRPGVDTFEAAPQSPIAKARAGGIDAAKEILPNLKPSDLGAAKPFLSDLDTSTGKRSRPTPEKFFDSLTTHADKPEVQEFLNAPGREQLKASVRKHAVESALSQLTTEINKPSVKIPQQVAGKITDKKQLLGQLVNAYATMPDLRPMMQKSVPQITDVLDRLNKLQGLS